MLDRVIPKRIAEDARWLIQGLDVQNQLVRIVKMSKEDYRQASFLDQRMFETPRESVIQPWSDVVTASKMTAAPPAQWIFHIGHVGSTLIARLLGELDGVLSIREPGVLRDVLALPQGEQPEYAGILASLLGRRFAGQHHVVVKATSFVSELASTLAARSKALMMYVSPRRYIASILGGPNSLRELVALADYRSGRLSQRFSDPIPAPPNQAALAALAWATEMTALEAAAEALGHEKVLWIDFDHDFLAKPGTALKSIADHFGIPIMGEAANAALCGPIMHRYSKDMRYEFSANLRADVLAQASMHHAHDINTAISMLGDLADRFPKLTRALARTEH